MTLCHNTGKYIYTIFVENVIMTNQNQSRVTIKVLNQMKNKSEKMLSSENSDLSLSIDTKNCPLRGAVLEIVPC